MPSEWQHISHQLSLHPLQSTHDRTRALHKNQTDIQSLPFFPPHFGPHKFVAHAPLADSQQPHDSTLGGELPQVSLTPALLCARGLRSWLLIISYYLNTYHADKPWAHWKRSAAWGSVTVGLRHGMLYPTYSPNIHKLGCQPQFPLSAQIKLFEPTLRQQKYLATRWNRSGGSQHLVGLHRQILFQRIWWVNFISSKHIV